METELPFVSLCYDDFIIDPQKYLKVICKILDMDYSERKLNFWEKTHHQVFGSGGTAKQVMDGSSRIFRQVEYPPQFEAQIQSIKVKLNDDVEVTAIINKMEARKISSLDPAQKSLFNYDNFGEKPFWYYKQKVALKIKRYFPETYR
jgi:hypothetical protein